MAHIFISYSHTDSVEVARKLADALREAGVSAWIDQEIPLGQNWSEALEQAIEQASAFLVVLSPGARSSRWVKEEIAHAQKLGKPILAVATSPQTADISWLPEQQRRSIRVFQGEGDVTDALNNLLQYLGSPSTV